LEVLLLSSSLSVTINYNESARFKNRNDQRLLLIIKKSKRILNVYEIVLNIWSFMGDFLPIFRCCALSRSRAFTMISNVRIEERLRVSVIIIRNSPERPVRQSFRAKRLSRLNTESLHLYPLEYVDLF